MKKRSKRYKKLKFRLRAWDKDKDSNSVLNPKIILVYIVNINNLDILENISTNSSNTWVYLFIINELKTLEF